MAYLNRMVSNDVEGLPPGGSCEALLLTPKARIVAPLVVWRRGEDDFLLLTEPGSGRAPRARAGAGALRGEVRDRRRGASVDRPARPRTGIESTQARGEPRLRCPGDRGDRRRAAGRRGADLEDELERLRILARTPRLGRELDDRVMPAEAGLEERAISFTKGCYPGQEPVARLHFRGHPNRGLRVVALDGGELPGYDAELALDGKVVGRVTSAAPDPELGVVALAYVRREVPVEATLGPRGSAGHASPGPTTRLATLPFPAPVAQGIERCPAEAEVASSNLAGRMRRGGTMLPSDPLLSGRARPPGRRAGFLRILPAWPAHFRSSSRSRGVRTRGSSRCSARRARRASGRSSTGFPEAVGVLWAMRDAAGRIVDFAFGYGNPAMLRGFRLPAETADKLHAARGAAADAREPRLRRLRRRLRDRRAVRQRGSLRHAVRRRLHAAGCSCTASRKLGDG